MMTQNQFHLVWKWELHDIFKCMGFSSLASVGPMGITNSFNAQLLPDLELSFHKLDIQWHFLCAGDHYVFMCDIPHDITLEYLMLYLNSICYCYIL